MRDRMTKRSHLVLGWPSETLKIGSGTPGYGSLWSFSVGSLDMRLILTKRRPNPRPHLCGGTKGVSESARAHGRVWKVGDERDNATRKWT